MKTGIVNYYKPLPWEANGDHRSSDAWWQCQVETSSKLWTAFFFVYCRKCLSSLLTFLWIIVGVMGMKRSGVTGRTVPGVILAESRRGITGELRENYRWGVARWSRSPQRRRLSQLGFFIVSRVVWEANSLPVTLGSHFCNERRDMITDPVKATLDFLIASNSETARCSRQFQIPFFKFLSWQFLTGCLLNRYFYRGKQ